ncbi:hypothetical protein [Leptospira adleri]|uniref:Uncharacterized protein n=1 Tax=Leptospira adleri TaxID=2023186 RepID=A0ABX4NRI9_9LEPT|nr:hypothetical protein [Leptospira adleri]PJZ59441.1 hypothetical protein CH376_23700 [Leptospira adleri]
MQTSESVIAEVGNGFLYIFKYYIKKERLEENPIIKAIKNSYVFQSKEYDTYITFMLANQINIDKPIQEQNSLDEEQDLIRRLWVESIRNSESNDQFFDELFKSSE